jgi:elongation factor G
LKFSPIFLGTAFKNKGVQCALDGVIDYLPNPSEKQNHGFRITNNKEEKIIFETNPKKQFIGYAFKLEENKFG